MTKSEILMIIRALKMYLDYWNRQNCSMGTHERIEASRLIKKFEQILDESCE